MAGEQRQRYETLAELEIIPVIGILLAGYWLWKLKPWQSVKKCIIFICFYWIERMDPKEESNVSEDDTRNDDFSDMAEELDKDEKTGFPKFYDLDDPGFQQKMVDNSTIEDLEVPEDGSTVLIVKDQPPAYKDRRTEVVLEQAGQDKISPAAGVKVENEEADAAAIKAAKIAKNKADRAAKKAARDAKRKAAEGGGVKKNVSFEDGEK